MTSRNRRALWILILWGVGIGIWVLGRVGWARHQELRMHRATLAALAAKETWLGGVLQQTRVQREKLLNKGRPAWFGLAEDQLFLRFQDAILGAAQKAGLQEVRLKAIPSTDGIPVWRIEAVGSLAQWMDFIEGVGRGGMPLDLRGLHWLVNGDPWNPPKVDGLVGPALRGETEWGGVAPQAISGSSMVRGW